MTVETHAPFEGRRPIRSKAFALRHVIIDELNRRRRSGTAAEQGTLLDAAARGLSVTLLDGRRGYEIRLFDDPVATVGADDVVLYQRGDGRDARHADAHSEGGVRDQNRALAGQLVESLLERARTIDPSTLIGESAGGPRFTGVSCVLPCYNEEANIARSVGALVASLDEELRTRGIIKEYEIIVVDDGSVDQSAAEVRAIAATAPQVKLVRHIKNQGYGAAVYSGLSTAQYDLVFFADSDNQFDYGQLRELLPLIEHCDAVCGYREHRQDPPIRKLNAFGWHLLVRSLFGRLVRDIDCAFKLFRRSALDQIDLVSVRGRGAIINTEMLVRLKQTRQRIVEVPVRHYPREVGSPTGANPIVIIRAFWELAKLVVRIVAEKLGWLGFVTGLYSRSRHPLEVIEVRRSGYLPAGTNCICAVCGSGPKHLRKTSLHTCSDLRHLGDFSVFYCTACANGFTYPVPEPEARAIPTDVEPVELGSIQRALIRRFLNIRVERVRETLRGEIQPRILDCGSGSCGFANALARSGCSVVALDPNPDNARFADASAGVEFYTGELRRELIGESFAAESFDAVTMWHSLEHMRDPAESVSIAHDLLKRGGSLTISVPNLNSLQADLGGNFWAYLDVPHHLIHFSLNGLISLLRAEGFVQFRVRWFSEEYEVFGQYQTLLNILTRSHNFFYNREKKGEHREELAYPRWTRIATACGPLLLPVVAVLSALAAATGKPSCVELHCFKPESAPAASDER